MDDRRPQLILTNDDGIDEPGLAALFDAAEGLGPRILIAPDGPRSSCGHAVTTGQSIRVERRADARYAIHGTPADCVRLGLDHLAKEAAWVLSGINAGGNLGTDTHHSGTVAAVREAVLHGIPGIALSHYISRGRPIDWTRASGWARDVIRDLMARSWEPGTFWNVNLPHPEPTGREPRIVLCPLDPSPLPLRFRHEPDGPRYDGDYHARARIAGGDIEVCFGGDIAVSRVRLMPAGDTPVS